MKQVSFDVSSRTNNMGIPGSTVYPGTRNFCKRRKRASSLVYSMMILSAFISLCRLQYR